MIGIISSPAHAAYRSAGCAKSVAEADFAGGMNAVGRSSGGNRTLLPTVAA